MHIFRLRLSRYASVLGAILLLTVSGCSRHGTPSPGVKDSVARYALRGIVLGKSDASQRITIRQDAIHGFMPATNMVYPIADKGLFEELQPGDVIRAEVLAPANSNRFRLQGVKIVAAPRGGSALAELPPHRLLIGEHVPEIPMVNQNGQTVTLGKFKGKTVLLTFIDTKCKDDCPIITGLFGKVNALLRESPMAYAKSRLISISIDPAYDTPPVLRRYGLESLHGDAKGFEHWEFVDLPPAPLKRLATAFAVMYAPSPDGDIVHTMQTALIAPDGKVAQYWPGDKWDPKVIANAIEAEVAKKP